MKKYNELTDKEKKLFNAIEDAFEEIAIDVATVGVVAANKIKNFLLEVKNE